MLIQEENTSVGAVASDERVIRTCSNACYFECGLLVHVRNGEITKIEGDPHHPFNKGYSCSRCQNYPQLLNHPDRITHPMRRRGKKGEASQWERISWDEALDTIADRLEEIRQRHGPLALAAGIDGRPQTWQTILLMRALGTPNVMACTDLCEGPALVADGATVGETVLQMTEADWEESLLHVVWGANPVVTHTPYWNDMLRARKKHGAKIIVIDPRLSETAQKADQWIRLRPGTDGALALAMIQVIISEKLYDADFVRDWCHGFVELKAHVAQYTPEWAETITEIPAAQIRELARVYATTKPACLYPRTGVTQKSNATQTARAQIILVCLTGNLDIKGGNPLNQRYPGLVTRGELVFDPRWRLAPEIEAQSVGMQTYPLGKKYIYVDNNPAMIRAMLYGDPYPIRGMFLTGTNPVMSSPQSRLVWDALCNLDFFVVADFFLTPTAELADIVLPAATWLERDDIGTEYSQKCMGIRQKAVETVGECKEDKEMIIALIQRMKQKGYQVEERLLPWRTMKEFNDFRLANTGMTFEDFRSRQIVDFEKTERIYKKRGFGTPTGKVELYSTVFKEYGHDPLPTYCEPYESPRSTPELHKKYPLVVMSGVKHRSYWHSDGRQLKWSRQREPDPEVMIHPDDAATRKISDGDWVWVEATNGNRIRLKAIVTTKVAQGTAAARHAWWFPEKDGPEHGAFDSNFNVLTRNNVAIDPISGCVTYKALLCEVRK